MIASMTGFGRGTADVQGTTATVELRSVNNRFCDVSIRMPRSLAAYESDLQNRVKEAFARGRITVQIQVEQAPDEALPLSVNAPVARGYARLLNALRQEAGIDAPLTLDHLLKYTDIFKQTEATPEQDETAWAAIQQAFEDAAEKMQAMRLREGKALAADLHERIGNIAARLDEVEAYAPERVVQARTRLHERLAELFEDERIDAERLEYEIALLADKLDVTEETVRLRAHLPAFRDALQQTEPVGRRLNFLSQEINREINTIGSKANDATIGHLVVGMKEELEKIREQVENIQ